VIYAISVLRRNRSCPLAWSALLIGASTTAMLFVGSVEQHPYCKA
jgi:hypothetical protein